MAKERETILSLSASRVKTYKQCPRKYYYTYIERLPRKHWDHFDLGTLVHGALEFFHEEYRADAEDLPNLKRLMKESFKKQKEAMILDGDKLTAETLLTARDLLVGYLKRIETKGIGAEILGVEDKFDLPLGENYTIKGVVDRVDRDEDGILHIKDYKTNKNPKYMEPFQLKTYGLYLMDKYPDIDRFRGSYIMMRFEGMPIPYDFTREDVDKVQKELLDYANRITEEERWISKPSILCDWCDFKDPCLNTW